MKTTAAKISETQYTIKLSRKELLVLRNAIRNRPTINNTDRTMPFWTPEADDFFQVFMDQTQNALDYTPVEYNEEDLLPSPTPNSINGRVVV